MPLIQDQRSSSNISSTRRVFFSFVVPLAHHKNDEDAITHKKKFITLTLGALGTRMCWRRGCDEVAPERVKGGTNACGKREDHPHHQPKWWSDLVCILFIHNYIDANIDTHIDTTKEIWNSVTCCSYRRPRPYPHTCQRYSSTSKRYTAPTGSSNTLSPSSARSARPRIARSATMIALLAAIRWRTTHHGDGF